MTNNKIIQKLKNNAEVAWAAYGYYDLIGKEFKGEDIENTDRVNSSTITLHDIMDSAYYDYETQDSTFFNAEKLKGDMTPTQAKRFFEKYDLLDFYPKLDNKNNKQQKGFHACLFQDKESKEYTLAIISTESKRAV